MKRRTGRSTSRWIRGIKDTDLAKALAERARANPVAPPSAKVAKGAKRLPSFIFLRPECKDQECGPDPDDDPVPPTNPCAGMTFVWQPDLAAQLNTGEATCPSAADLARVQQAVGRNLARFKLPDPEVRVSCTAGNIFIRIWGTRVQPGSCGDEARNRAQVPDLVAGGNFGIFINSSLIRRLAADAFAAAPKRLSGNGAPSPFGPVHLTGLSVVFKAPHTIQTRITGYDERPWPDVDFTHVVDDTLLSLRGCSSTAHDEFSVIDQVIAALLLGVFSIALPILLPAFAFVLFNDIDAAVNPPSGNGGGAVGCRLVGTLPDEIALPATGGLLPPIARASRRGRIRLGPDIVIQPKKEKLVIAYGQPTVDDRGLFVGALASRADRVPSVRLAGPANLAMFFNANSTFGEYTINADDFFGTLTVEWSAGSNATVVNQGHTRTRINFARGNAQPGDSFQRTVTVRVTDQEGSSAMASRTVTIFVNEPDGLPPICQIKPWLPQCNPDGPDV